MLDAVGVIDELIALGHIDELTDLLRDAAESLNM